MGMKPILFNAEMVRAILNGRKTVTRRVIKFPEKQTGRLPSNGDKDYLFYPCGIKRSPYQPGDILYVRETWAINNITPHDPDFVYKSDYDCNKEPYCDWKWRPSIHMPKEAARIFLRVTDVRVERLRDIRRDEAVREGASPACAVLNFKAIWNTAIKPADRDRYGWDANPRVWVIEFERISKEDAHSNEINP